MNNPKLIFALALFLLISARYKPLRIVTEIKLTDQLVLIGIRGKKSIDTIQAIGYIRANKQLFSDVDSFVFINCDTAIMITRTCLSNSVKCFKTQGLDMETRYLFWRRAFCGRTEVITPANTFWCGCRYKITPTKSVSVCVFSKGFHP